MVIREAVQADVTHLVEMGRQQIAALYGTRVPDNPAHLTALAEQLIGGAESVMLVADDEDGRPMGMIGMLCYPHHLSGQRTAGEVCWWVNPSARGTGVALLKRAERWALEMGATQIQMMAPDARVGALYERRGYDLVELSYLKPLEQVSVNDSAGVRVHDNVLPDPLAYRTRALAQRFQTFVDGPVKFHGIAPCVDPTVPMWLKEQYPLLQPNLSFFRCSPLGQEEPHTVHSDRSMGSVTAILYLNPEPPDGDGTVFVRNRHTGALESTAEIGSQEWESESASWFDPEQWDVVSHVPARFNRLVVFPAARFHSRAIAENYGTSPDEARLIQVVFCDGALE